MIPLVLIGTGGLLAGLGALAAGKEDRPVVSPAPRSRASVVRWVALVRNTLSAARALGQVVPPMWLLLGHIAKESGGNPNDSTDNVCCRKEGGTCVQFCRERGLMQLMPEQSQSMGLDHDRMFDPAYSVAAGVKMYQRYHESLRKTFIFASDDDLWRLAYYTFAVGAGRVTSVSMGAPQPIAWSSFAAHVRAVCASRPQLCKPSTLRALDNTAAVWEQGRLLAQPPVV